MEFIVYNPSLDVNTYRVWIVKNGRACHLSEIVAVDSAKAALEWANLVKEKGLTFRRVKVRVKNLTDNIVRTCVIQKTTTVDARCLDDEYDIPF